MLVLTDVLLINPCTSDLNSSMLILMTLDACTWPVQKFLYFLILVLMDVVLLNVCTN